MCTRQEIEDIIKKEVAIVRNDLIQNEGREFLGHKELEERINDRIDHVLVAVRASHPSVETMKEVLGNQTRIEEKLDALTVKVAPAVDVIEVSQKIRKWVIWISGFMLAVAGIITSMKHMK